MCVYVYVCVCVCVCVCVYVCVCVCVRVSCGRSVQLGHVSCGRSVQLGHLHVLLVISAAEIRPKHSPRLNIPCNGL